MIALDTLTQGELLVLLPRLRRYARVLTADLRRADELVLDTLTRASRRRYPLAPWPHLRNWLFGAMHRLHGERSAQARRKLAPSLDTDGYAVGTREFLPPAPLRDRAGADEMLARLLRLPVEQREVLVLVALEGLSYAEIATLLGTPIGTVMSTLNCAREGMRSMTVESVAPGLAGK
jgi:RNA polymerase sigma-70 factor (ECF subfamily)